METKLSGRQKALTILYPFVMKVTKWLGKKSKMLHNEKATVPPSSIYDLSVLLNNGKLLPLLEAKGKKLLLVNTASDCGYTAQYAELQQLQETYKDRLLVIGFPANDFKDQEKEDDAAIAQFCQRNFGVTFPLAKKSTVVKEAGQNAVFHWLSHKEKNGWNNQPPSWNFSKYLVDEKGTLTHYFDPSVSPLSKEVITAIQ
jgi:glutathione peroxidase